MFQNRTLALSLPLVIFLLSLNAFIFGIGNPARPYFDEVRYIAAAKQMHSGGVNQNWSHPPLAKLIIGAGIQLKGDNPLGWRIMSAIFGALSLTSIYLLGLILFESQVYAAAVVALTFLNQIHFVQSRIAMLDVFMVTFMTFALAALTWILFRPQAPSRAKVVGFIFSGLCFGLALACKWSAAVLVIPFLAAFISAGTFGPGRRRFLWGGLAFVILPLITYLLTSLFLVGMTHPGYAPRLPSFMPGSAAYSATQVISLQAEMLKAQLGFQNELHPFQSPWYTWPAMTTPVWYDIDRAATQGAQDMAGVLCAANPLILWLGFVAVLLCLWNWYRRRTLVDGWIALLFFSLWLPWAIVPRSTEFFYYYYPATLILGFALVRVFNVYRLPAWCLGLFIAVNALVFTLYFPLLTHHVVSEHGFQLRFLAWSWF